MDLCAYCGKVITATPSVIKRRKTLTNRGICCSRSCAVKLRVTKGTPLERFWKLVDKTPGLGPKGECWEWRGVQGEFGHGRTREKSLMPNINKGCYLGAHRVSFYLEHGEFDYELNVCHTCDNPPCVNPEHLFPDTQKANIHDCIEKGRWNPPKGEKNHLALFTDLQVLQLRKSYLFLNITLNHLSSDLKIKRQVLRNILIGATYKHLPYTLTPADIGEQPRPASGFRKGGMYTEDQILQIKKALSEGLTLPQVQAKLNFEFSPDTFYKIKQNRIYRHLSL